MIGVHPYCIVPGSSLPTPGLTGVDGAAVIGYDVGGLTVWASPFEEAPPPDLERVRQHHGVIEAVGPVVTPVPIRFGGWAPSPETLCARIAARAEEMEAVLTAVAGRVEFGVRLSDPSSISETPRPAVDSGATGPRDPPPRPGPNPSEPRGGASGREYLHARAREHVERRERRRRGRALLERLRTHLDGIESRERITPLASPGLLAVAHLVARSESRWYVDRVDAFGRDIVDECEVHLTGPWPPYSFTAP